MSLALAGFVSTTAWHFAQRHLNTSDARDVEPPFVMISHSCSMGSLNQHPGEAAT